VADRLIGVCHAFHPLSVDVDAGCFLRGVGGTGRARGQRDRAVQSGRVRRGAEQKPILSHLLSEPRFKDLIVYNIDFDSQKDLVREMGAQKQSTLIVFTGKTEKGRSTGETDPAAIESLLARSAG
jgi:hypothetical protein